MTLSRFLVKREKKVKATGAFNVATSRKPADSRGQKNRDQVVRVAVTAACGYV